MSIVKQHRVSRGPGHLQPISDDRLGQWDVHSAAGIGWGVRRGARHAAAALCDGLPLGETRGQAGFEKSHRNAGPKRAHISFPFGTTPGRLLAPKTIRVPHCGIKTVPRNVSFGPDLGSDWGSFWCGSTSSVHGPLGSYSRTFFPTCLQGPKALGVQLSGTKLGDAGSPSRKRKVEQQQEQQTDRCRSSNLYW